MRPVAFGEALPAGTRLTLFSDDKPDASLPSLSSGWMRPQAGLEGFDENGPAAALLVGHVLI